MSARGAGCFELPVEVEIMKEKASALGRVGERLDASLARLAILSARIAEADRHERHRLEAEYRAERARAAELRYYLVVQREALGVRRHADVDRAYPVPPPITE